VPPEAGERPVRQRDQTAGRPGHLLC
jgi:hypothetical protein